MWNAHWWWRFLATKPLEERACVCVSVCVWVYVFMRRDYFDAEGERAWGVTLYGFPP